MSVSPTLGIRLPAEVLAELRRRADGDARSPSAYARLILQRAIEAGITTAPTVARRGDEVTDKHGG